MPQVPSFYNCRRGITVDVQTACPECESCVVRSAAEVKQSRSPGILIGRKLKIRTSQAQRRVLYRTQLRIMVLPRPKRQADYLDCCSNGHYNEKRIVVFSFARHSHRWFCVRPASITITLPPYNVRKTVSQKIIGKTVFSWHRLFRMICFPVYTQAGKEIKLEVLA